MQNNEIKFLSKLKTHSYSISKINDYIYKGNVVERQLYDVSINIYFNNEIIFKEKRFPNPLLLEGNRINVDVIKLLERDNEWKEKDYDEFLFKEGSIANLQRINAYNNYIENVYNLKHIIIKRDERIKLKKQKMYTGFFLVNSKKNKKNGSTKINK